MTNKQGCNIVEDKTPAMGALPIKKSGNNDLKDKNAVALTQVKRKINYSLVSVKNNHVTEITKFPFIIGRLSTDDLQIRKSEVSRSHAKIDFDNDALVIMNNSSLNGIRVNGHKVDRVILNDGDEICIASEKYTLKIECVDQIVKTSNGVHGDENVDEIILQPLDYTSNYSAQTDYSSTELSDEIFDNDSSYASTIERKESNKGRLMMFSLFGIIVITGTLLGYQYYNQYTQESRVFVAQSANTATTEPSGSKTTDQTSTSEDKQSNPVESGTSDTKKAPLDKQLIAAPLSKPLQKSVIAQKSKNPPVTQLSIKKNHRQQLNIKQQSLKKMILFEHANSKNSIIEAKNSYLEGKYAKSVELLSAVEANRRHQAEYRVTANQLRHQIIELNSYFVKGNAAYAKNDKNEAFNQWGQLLKQHRVYFNKSESFYTTKLNTIVASEYEDRGNKAYVNQDWKIAYKNWKNSVSIRPKSSVEKSIQLMDAEIKQLYRTGYRYETVNIERAIEYWKSLVNKAPSDHEYYIKAAAKLRWYESVK